MYVPIQTKLQVALHQIKYDDSRTAVNHAPSRTVYRPFCPCLLYTSVAIITPMNEDKSVNFDKLGEIIDDQIKNHTDAIIICGTTGEASTLTHEEHLDCIRLSLYN